MRLLLAVLIGVFASGSLYAQTAMTGSYGKATSQNQVTARSAASTATANRTPQVAVFFDDFSVKKTLAGQIFCQMTFYVKNDSNMQIDALVTDIKWPGISTNLNFENIPPKEVKSLRYALVGPGCYTMGEAPTLNISSCLMRSWNKDGKVVDVPNNICKNMVAFR
ncbi:MAG: hypothetical protein IKD08_03455 [Alphaproteobacteria bacterium]|nr:hypothetical protein [Alphaproteobacteria bacterium]